MPMNIENQHRSGCFRKVSAGYKAFFPAPLPPEPVLELPDSLQLQLSRSDRAIGALNMVISVLPNPELLEPCKIGWVEQHLQSLRGKATKLVGLAEQLDIVRQISQGKRNRKYAHHQYIDILSEGTELN